MMTVTQQDLINAITCANTRLLYAAKAGEMGKYVTELTTIERLARQGREQVMRRTVIDWDSTNDEDL